MKLFNSLNLVYYDDSLFVVDWICFFYINNYIWIIKDSFYCWINKVFNIVFYRRNGECKNNVVFEWYYMNWVIYFNIF